MVVCAFKVRRRSRDDHQKLRKTCHTETLIIMNRWVLKAPERFLFYLIYDIINGEKNNRGESQVKEKKKDYSRILGIIFIIWFVASLIGMCFFAEANQLIMFIIVGQYFFIFAMMAFMEQGRELMPLIHLTVGICFMVVPLIIKVWPVFTDMTPRQYFFDVGFPAVSIILGYIFLIKSRFENDKEKYKSMYAASFILYVLEIIRIIMVCL